MEYADSLNIIQCQIQDEIIATREDHLREMEYYKNQLPEPISPVISQ